MDADQLRDGADGAGGSLAAIVAVPVSAGASGEGLPYAPEDWPLPGDKWKWRVGLRATPTGYFQDRYTRPPARFNYKTGLRGWISGRASLEKFVCEHIPNADLEKFFASFVWKVPANHVKVQKDSNTKGPSCLYSRFANGNGHLEAKVMPKDGECKAGSKACYAWVQTRKGSLPIIDCDLCCLEVGFCRDCCCILCCKTVDLVCGSYNFIRCQGVIDAMFTCGHVAHLNCALRAYLAGKVRGSIDLDAEYYCRRCDNKTDLVTHLTQLLSGSKAVHSRADTEQILNLGLCLLHGSGKHEARRLHSILLPMLKKLRDGVNLEEIWALGENLHNLTTARTGSVMEIPAFEQQQSGRGDSTDLASPMPVLINLKGKEPTLLMLHEVPISLQIQDPSAEPPHEDLSRRKRSFHMLPLPGQESHKKVRQEHLNLPEVQWQEKLTVVAPTEVQKELREARDTNSDVRETALLPEAPLRINHLDAELDQIKTDIVNRLKDLRKEVRSRREAKLKEAREGDAKLNNVSNESHQLIQKECKTSSGLKKLDRRLNHALGYCQALMQFHRKYPDIDISEFYQSLGRIADLDSL